CRIRVHAALGPPPRQPQGRRGTQLGRAGSSGPLATFTISVLVRDPVARERHVPKPYRVSVAGTFFAWCEDEGLVLANPAQRLPETHFSTVASHGPAADDGAVIGGMLP